MLEVTKFIAERCLNVRKDSVLEVSENTYVKTVNILFRFFFQFYKNT